MNATEIRIDERTFEIFITREQINERVIALASELNARMVNKYPILMPVLTGAYYFTSLLVAQLNFKYAIDFVKVSSYGRNMKSSGEPLLIFKHQLELMGRPVIIIEDVIESGLTTEFLYNNLQTYQPESVEIMTFLFKPDRFEGKIKPHSIGFEVGNEFVIGFGMDLGEDYRYLPDIYRLKKE
jgi:hypoxanthine phosphoribosyltransferase